MKRLKIKYGNVILFDDDVAEVSWNDNENGVTVTGKTKVAASSGGGSLFDILSAAAKKQNSEGVGQAKNDQRNELVMSENTIDAEE